MKDFFAGLIGLVLYGVGCVVYLAVWGIGVVFALWMGLLVIRWIF